VAIIGSGNWGSAIATIIGANCARHDCLDTIVNMYVYEETIVTLTTGDGDGDGDGDGSKEQQQQRRYLTDIINEEHENVKYLPGVALPENVVAVPDLATACKDATLLVFVTPHLFMMKMLPAIVASASVSQSRVESSRVSINLFIYNGGMEEEHSLTYYNALHSSQNFFSLNPFIHDIVHSYS